MKKSLFVIAVICGLSFNSNAQAVREGSILVDAYYGFPNLYGFIFNTLVKDAYPQGTSVTSSSIGPMGAKAEYLLTDKFGMGIDVNYSNASISLSQVGADANGNPITYNYKFSTPALRAMVGFNFHFVRTDHVDVYTAVKAGYYNRSLSFTSNDPNVQTISLSHIDPVAFRAEIGMRYYFTENIGLNANIGFFGGPLMAIGISGKFGGK